MTKKLTGDIEVASHDADGQLKPVIYIHNDNYTHHLLQLEALEGYHDGTSKILSKDGKPKRMYYGFGYFKVKPKFTVAVYEGTSDPMPKRDRNGNMMGVWEMKDALDNSECLMWCYSQPKNQNVWEVIKQQIEYIIFRMQLLGYTEVDADGYLPIVIRIGKAATRFGAKYATVAGWDDRFETIRKMDFMELNSPITESIDIPTPRMANKYETSQGPTVLYRGDT